MPPAGYPAFLQYLQSGRVRRFRSAGALRFDHYQVHSPDVEKSAAFYAGLGLRIVDYYLGNKEGHIPTRSASEGPMKSSESRRGSPLDD